MAAVSTTHEQILSRVQAEHATAVASAELRASKHASDMQVAHAVEIAAQDQEAQTQRTLLEEQLIDSREEKEALIEAHAVEVSKLTRMLCEAELAATKTREMN